MRIRVSHRTSYVYEHPARSLVQLLRLTPRRHEGQQVIRWRLDMDSDASLRKGEDPLGNITHRAFVAGPVSRLTLSVEGEVETWDTHGVVRGAVERFAPEVFLRSTPLTEPGDELIAFARDLDGADTLATLHALMGELHQRVTFDTAPTHSATTAEEAFALKRGVCQDLAHIFIAAARTLGVPARYVSGHLARADGVAEQEAAHAWAEAYAPDLGWIGFDPTNGVCATPAYIRVAIGLDYLGAAPVRGARTGGGREALDVSLTVAHALHQAQG